jgi:hypothetical protein
MLPSVDYVIGDAKTFDQSGETTESPADGSARMHGSGLSVGNESEHQRKQQQAQQQPNNAKDRETEGRAKQSPSMIKQLVA